MKKIVSLILVMLAILLVGCASDTEASSKARNIQDRIYNDIEATFEIVVDEETGVNYIIYNGYKQGGITPRLNADGTLYIEGQNSNK